MLISIIFISGVLIDGNFDFWIQHNDHFDSSGHFNEKGVVLKESDEPQTFFLSQAFAENDVLTFQSTVKSPQGNLTRCHGNIILIPMICVGTIKNDTIVWNCAVVVQYMVEDNDKIQGLLARRLFLE